VPLSAVHENASGGRGARFVFGVGRVRVDGDDGYRYVHHPPMDATMSGGGVKAGDGHDHDVRPVRHPFRHPLVVEEARHHGLGDAGDLAFGGEERLGDGPEDVCTVPGFPVVEFVPDVFVDCPTELLELRGGSGGGVFGGGGY
jgi:hypothetical protein